MFKTCRALNVMWNKHMQTEDHILGGQINMIYTKRDLKSIF